MHMFYWIWLVLILSSLIFIGTLIIDATPAQEPCTKTAQQGFCGDIRCTNNYHCSQGCWCDTYYWRCVY